MTRRERYPGEVFVAVAHVRPGQWEWGIWGLGVHECREGTCHGRATSGAEALPAALDGLAACLRARQAGMSGEACTCCPPGKRPAIEHARGCPRRAPRTVPLTTLSVGDQLGPAPRGGHGRRWRPWRGGHASGRRSIGGGCVREE